MVKFIRPDQDTLVYLGVGNLAIEKAWEQVPGRPLTVSEWSTCLPNEYSLEGTALMTAYGLLQGWDGTMQFGYFSPDFLDQLGRGSFDLFGNPPQILQFPAAAARWHRRDVKEAGLVAESLYDPESVFEWTEDRKPLPVAAALVGKVDYRFVQQPRKAVAKEIAKFRRPETLTARSITGELKWDAHHGVVHIDAPRSQVLVGFPSAQTHDLAAISLKSANAFGTVYVTEMSGDAPVRSAQRLLVTAVGPAWTHGMEYEKASRMSRLGPAWHLKSLGEGPAMLEAISGELGIRNSHARSMKAWTLDVTGKRCRQIPVVVDSGAVVLKLQPNTRPCTTNCTRSNSAARYAFHHFLPAVRCSSRR
jgi:hypothetical protein